MSNLYNQSPVPLDSNPINKGPLVPKERPGPEEPLFGSFFTPARARKKTGIRDPLGSGNFPPSHRELDDSRWMGLGERLVEEQKKQVLSILRTPDKAKTSKHLKSIHVLLIRTGIHRTSSFAVGNFVARCGTLGLMAYAAQVFNQMAEPNSFVWNSMIRGFQQNNRPETALLFLDQMRARFVTPDHFTFLYSIKACADARDKDRGIQVHGQLIKHGFGSDLCIGTGLIEFYSLFDDDMSRAKQVFDEMQARDAVSWTVMISGYVNGSGGMETARKLFDEMPTKDLVACSIMVVGYAKIGEMASARELFDKAPVKDLLMYNTMLGGYAKSNEIDDLLKLFDEMVDRDIVSWNTVINGLVQSKRINKAMALFHSMQLENLRPNEVTLMSILSGCAQAGALDIGRWLHSYIDRNHFGLDAVVGTALVDMYSKCGVLDCAQDVFSRLVSRDVAAWNAMIKGFSMNGQSKKALEFYYQMLDRGIKPNAVTMVGVLSACVHAGLVDGGHKFFDDMSTELGITPKIEHYGCMVDLLGRAGLLDEAYDFIQHMPIVPHAGVWGALLGACKIHNSIKLAECCMEHLLELDLEDGGYLAIMSNIYVDAGRWDDMARVRETMIEKRVYKMPGCSSIEVNGVVYQFGAGDRIHPNFEDIYQLLDQISMQLRRSEHIDLTGDAS